MATHSSILAWRIPWTEETGRLQLQRVGHSCRDSSYTHAPKHLLNSYHKFSDATVTICQQIIWAQTYFVMHSFINDILRTYWASLDSSVGKESACNVGDPGLIPGQGRSPGEGIGYPLQYSWASLVARLVKNPPAMWETWVGKIPWRRERLPTPVFWPREFHGLYSP